MLAIFLGGLIVVVFSFRQRRLFGEVFLLFSGLTTAAARDAAPVAVVTNGAADLALKTRCQQEEDRYDASA